MKKVLMVIFVLSLLGLLAVPVLANVLADSGPDCLIGPKATKLGTYRPAGVENPVQIARGTWRKAGVENPVQVARGTWRKAEVENPVQVAGFWRPPAPRG